ncbi:FAD dependent oxidoreductase [Fistulina hepatica ATCC 64428]|uniref:FAD dependent oxidoreductase n=1 Tax=Fistulina hepatica ATCC 64428 TaxID=1128425 RepID=A0A0D7AG65_9AGAR|nr:FAD dependent oxidoreductase [Fistulina hepatica ATCC 64428]
MHNQDSHILIIGAGCFGISTAYYLLTRGYHRVTVIERSTVLPAVDSSSNDINRIVRTSYATRFYAELAKEAIGLWKDTSLYGDSYHECGVLTLGGDNPADPQTAYNDASFANDLALGCVVKNVGAGAGIRDVFPPDTPTGDFASCTGYLNKSNGYAVASQGLKRLTAKVVDLGAQIMTGKTVVQLLKTNGRTTGVLCDDGTIIEGSVTVIATGSWTPSTFPDLNLRSASLANGQCVAMIELTEEEAKVYGQCPAVLDFNTGFYVFPPNAERLLKMAFHESGLTHTVNGVSTPRTVSTAPNGLAIPKAKLSALRKSLRAVYPALASKPFVATRLCWYNDTPDSDWLIGYHPADPNIVLATGGSGHAFKFLPVIGRLVADTIQGVLPLELVRKFAVDRAFGPSVDPREAPTVSATEIDLNDLCAPDDLAA